MQTYPACKELLVSINNYATVSQCQKTFYLELEKTALILVLKTLIMTNSTVDFCDVLLGFQGENRPCESSTSRQFT